ncbi:MAG TPA: hypothetical protein VME24_13290 [Alphaproteobacteria bacterium]|nr:hypothetical protein [Alphaproteobacteria bacterium]
MKKRITYVSPLQLGIVLALLYGLISLILVPFLLLGAMFGPHGGFGAIFVIFIPIIYAAGGFIGGVLSAFLYNIVAKWSGGIEYIASEAPSGV